MKPDYKNWMPKGMVYSFLFAALGCGAAAAASGQLLPGGTFALHDIFSKSKYGDMQAFVKKLRDMGYEKVELIDTTDGRFMKKSEASWMALSGSALLTGRK